MPNLLNRIFGTRFEYDALKGAGKRKQAPPANYREDQFTRGEKHRRLQGSAADLARNLSLAMWMVRRHLDYVSQFEYKSRTGIDELDEQLKQLMIRSNRRHNADVARKFTREKLFRLAECRRVLDGDTLLVKLNSGRLQGIQADLIRDPDDPMKSEDWISGVRIDRFGSPRQFGVYSRKGYLGKEFTRSIDARNTIFYGFFDRYAQDQVRGVSPLVSALNPLRDVYENFNYALMKAKVSQLFALAFERDSTEAPFPGDEEYGMGGTDPDGDHVQEPKGFQAFMKSDTRYVDLSPGEKVQIIESKQPSNEFQSFTNLVIQVALKALDIPYSFYDESFTNFFGSRSAWLHYERSCKDKRDDQIEMRREYTVWKYQEWIRDGLLSLPAGWTIEDLKFEWVPLGMPWWDPSKEVKGQVASIDAGLDNPQNICKATGTDFYENVDAISHAMEYAEERGVMLSFGKGGVVFTGQVTPTTNEEPEDDSEEETGEPDQDTEEES